MVEHQLQFNFYQLPELSPKKLAEIRKAISLRWKGMANRANYQDMNEAVGTALRLSPMSIEDKREFAISVAKHLHDGYRPVVRDMMVDHVCRIAGVPFERIEEVLNNTGRYPFKEIRF